MPFPTLPAELPGAGWRLKGLGFSVQKGDYFSTVFLVCIVKKLLPLSPV
jgi:hypothetical protein